MLSLPRFTRSLLDSLDEDFMVWPMDYLVPFRQRWPELSRELATPTIKDNKYTLGLDLRQFDPADISVKMDQNTVKVSGKREKKEQDGRYEYREYHHQFTVPENVQSEEMKCRLDDKGFLQIEAPVKGQIEDKKERSIPIEFVGGNRAAIKQNKN